MNVANGDRNEQTLRDLSVSLLGKIVQEIANSEIQDERHAKLQQAQGMARAYRELQVVPTTILKKVRTTPNQGPGSGSAEIEYFQFVQVFHRELLRLVITDHDNGETKCARGRRPHVLLPFELR